MKKILLAVLLMGALVAALGLAACSSSEEAPADEATEAATDEGAVDEAVDARIDGGAYGYAGEDPAEAAVYQYLVEEVSKNFDKADVSIPTVSIVNVDYTNPDEIVVKGDFWIDNYNIEGDTLSCVSGGNFPGVMHISTADYTVTAFDPVADGADFDKSAKELFGDDYDAFMAVYSDDEARAELRKVTVSDYVNLNGLDEVTQFQDFGQDPVELYKQ